MKKIRKLSSLFIRQFAVVLLISVLLSVAATGAPPSGISVSASSAVLMDASSGNVLYEKDAHTERPMASTTKIMTALIAIEEYDLKKTVTVSKEAVGVEGSSVYLYENEKLTMEELVFALMLESANDAATAIAIEIAGSVEEFAELMNEKAEELGLENTSFENPHGLDGESHYTTAYDIYLMFQEALKYDAFQEIIGSSEYYSIFIRDNDKYGIMWQSTNYYHIGEATPPQDVEVIGGKTGTTDEAGSCLCLLAKDKYGDSHVSIILNAGDKETLYAEMNKLLSKINN